MSVDGFMGALTIAIVAILFGFAHIGDGKHAGNIAMQSEGKGIVLFGVGTTLVLIMLFFVAHVRFTIV